VPLWQIRYLQPSCRCHLQQQLKRQIKALNWRRVLMLTLNTIIFFALYRVLVARGYFVHVFTLYGLALLGLAAGYIIYNRGLLASHISREQLPDDWSEAQKDAFFADANRRLERSKWMLLIIFPLCITFAYEVIEVMLFPIWFG
jgi:hypothetical protein